MNNTTETPLTNELVQYGVRFRQLAVVELDVCFEYTDENDEYVSMTGDQAANAFAVKHDVAVKLVSKQGPTGWPVYEFAGALENVVALIADYEGESIA